MTELQKRCIAALNKWCKDNKIPATSYHHISPRAYVVGHAAPACLVVATCHADSEPQCKEFNRINPLNTIHRFDSSLRAGSWATVAYIVTPSYQEKIAIQVVK